MSALPWHSFGQHSVQFTLSHSHTHTPEYSTQLRSYPNPKVIPFHFNFPAKRQCGKLVSQFWLMRNVAQFDGRQCKVRAIHSRHPKVCSTLAFFKLTGIFAGLLLVTVIPAVEIVIAHKAYGNTIAAPTLELLLLAVGGEGLSCSGREREQIKTVNKWLKLIMFLLLLLLLVLSCC